MFVHRSTNICTVVEFSTTSTDTHESKKEAMSPIVRKVSLLYSYLYNIAVQITGVLPTTLWTTMVQSLM